MKNARGEIPALQDSISGDINLNSPIKEISD
jgi:hypothetical protein